MNTVLIAGTGDRASATAIRLFRSGIPVILFEKGTPVSLAFHRTFTQTVYSGHTSLLDVSARALPHAVESGLVEDLVSVPDFVHFAIANREIPVLMDEEVQSLHGIEVGYVVRADAALMMHIPDSVAENARIIGFDDQEEEANYIVAVREPLRGLVRYPFSLEAFRNVEPLPEKKYHRVHLPMEGVFVALKKINDRVYEKEPIARINDIPVLSPENGRLVGLLNSGIIVPAGTDFAEIAPMHTPARGDVIPSAEWAVAGAVLEALLYDQNLENT